MFPNHWCSKFIGVDSPCSVVIRKPDVIFEDVFVATPSSLGLDVLDDLSISEIYAQVLIGIGGSGRPCTAAC